jgi:TolB-like protein/Tfp pilus assembly protein PilF
LLNFIEELKQRQVIKVATIYAVSAWPLIQIADLSVPALGLPDSVMTLLLQVFVAGFPISLIFAWLFNFTSHGIVRANVIDSQDGAPQANFHTTIAIVGSLILVSAIILGTQLLFDEKAIQKENTSTNLNETALQAATKENDTISSIAILPFVAFSSDPEDEFFADGMVEELLNMLAKVPELRVAARTSSFAYKGVVDKTIPEIGRELGVDSILEGSIRKNDTSNTIRITAQLVRVSSGEHLWSETYDRVYRDVFQIQDDIANAVVNKMKVTLYGDGQQSSFSQTSSRETLNIDAMIAYGKGQNELSHRTVASITEANEYFNQAVAFDANYARAYVGIADANLLLALYGNKAQDEANKLARQAIDKALSIDDQLAAAYATEGLLLSPSDYVKAEESFRRAIVLNQNYPMSYLWYGSLLKSRGKLQASQENFEKAFKLDPKSSIAAYNLAWGYYLLGDEDKSMQMFSQIIEIDPYFPGAYNLAAEIMSNHGRLDGSTKMYKRALEIDPVNFEAVSGLVITSMDLGDYTATKNWFEYINRHIEKFSEDRIKLLQARLDIVQGQWEEAMAKLEKIDLSDSMIGVSEYLVGEQAYYKGDYPEAIAAYQTVKAKDIGKEGLFFIVEDGLIAAHLAFAYQQIGDIQNANIVINDFEQFLENLDIKKFNSPDYYFKMALIRALQNNIPDVYYFMQGAIDLGWLQIWRAEQEPIFAGVVNDLQFAQMMGGIRARLATLRSRIDDQLPFLLAEREAVN